MGSTGSYQERSTGAGRLFAMRTYLDRILEAHRQRVGADSRPLAELKELALSQPAARPFAAALERSPQVALIAEVKRRSPSRGDLAPGLDPARLARSYAEGGASCLSVLTDSDFFGGSASDLASARAATQLPTLRKDFTLSPADVCDARVMGADALLLIAAALSDAELARFLSLAHEVGIEALVEVHDARELARALAQGAQLIGVNQRDLFSFEVDPDRALRLAGEIPRGVVKVAESGIFDPSQVLQLAEAGFDAVLVGEALVTSPDPVGATRSLCGISATSTGGGPQSAASRRSAPPARRRALL